MQNQSYIKRKGEVEVKEQEERKRISKKKLYLHDYTVKDLVFYMAFCPSHHGL